MVILKNHGTVQTRSMPAALGSLNARQRDNIEKALLICEPVAVATDRLQRDCANGVLLLQVAKIL